MCDTLSVKSGCLCIGSTIVYECAIRESVGLTVWNAPGYGEVSLPHSHSFIGQEGGNMNAHVRGISIDENCYISTLTIENITTNIIGENLTCMWDEGANNSQRIIGNNVLSAPNGKLMHACMYAN